MKREIINKILFCTKQELETSLESIVSSSIQQRIKIALGEYQRSEILVISKPTETVLKVQTDTGKKLSIITYGIGKETNTEINVEM